ncbi:hypothetical protein M153_7700030138, partial [Pseudoloma neurophilia]
LELKGNSEKIRWLRGGKLEFCRCVREVFDLIPANNITYNNITYNDITDNNITYNNITDNDITYNNITYNNITDNNITYNNITGSCSEEMLFDPSYNIIANMYVPACSQNCQISPSFTDKPFLVSITKACLVHLPEKRISVKEIERYLNEYLQRRVIVRKS